MAMNESELRKLKARLDIIGQQDAAEAYRKDVEYGHSWRREGGVGAYFTIWRKDHRILERLTRKPEAKNDPPQYDLFGHIAADPRDEGLIDDIRDFRRYLMHVEAEMMRQGVIKDACTDVASTSQSVCEPTTQPASTELVGEYPAIDVTPPKNWPKSQGMQHPFGFDPELDVYDPDVPCARKR